MEKPGWKSVFGVPHWTLCNKWLSNGVTGGYARESCHKAKPKPGACSQAEQTTVRGLTGSGRPPVTEFY